MVSSFNELNKQYEDAMDKLDPAEQEEPALKTFELTVAVSKTETYRVTAETEELAREKFLTEDLEPDGCNAYHAEIIECEEVS